MTTHSTAMLRGIIPPVITPLREPLLLDEEGARRQTRRLLAGGVHGIFVLGTTGEGPSVPPAVRQEMVRVVSHEVNGRVPLMAGISSACVDESLKMAADYAALGVDALSVTPPFYFPLGQDELVIFFRRLAPRLPLPFIAYDIPAMTKTHIEPDTVRRLMDIDSCIGIKDSSGNMIYHHELVRLARQREDFSVLLGPEEMLAEAAAAGSDGGVCGGANIDPGLYVELFDAARNGDRERVAQLRERIFLLRRIYFYGRFPSSIIKGVKCALRQMGVCTDVMSEPFDRFDKEQAEHIRAVLSELGLLDA